jgi:hypothetical protein
MSRQTIENTPGVAEPPSTKAIVKATVRALLIASVLLVTAVLPAEYGIDPLGTGKALRLTDLSKAEVKASTVTPPSPRPAGGSGSLNATIIPVLEPAADGGAPKIKGTFISQTKRYQMDSREITLQAGEGLEIKYNMRKGAGMVYSWTASDKLLFEFHGEPNVKPAGKEGTDYYETYDTDNEAGKDQAHGTFVAPSSGIHGWFWENKTPHPVTLKLLSSGFYDWIFQNRDNKETALKTMDPESFPGHPKVSDEVIH